MSDERHKRKETLSLILVSNIDNKSRHYSFSVGAFRAVVGLAVVVILTVAAAAVYFSGRAFREGQLQQEIENRSLQIAALEEENAALKEEILELELAREQEMKAQAETQAKAVASEEKKEEETKNVVSTFPRIYPSDGVGVLKESFSANHPYLSIAIPKGDNVVATGDGTILAIDYHDDFLHSIEIEHESGYVSRYFCDRDVTIIVEVGAMVKAGEPLFAIKVDQTQLHYQILLAGEAVNPFSVMKLEG